jgi:predicted AlkP superfamily phosphohydrolase/phosphomutase
MESMISNGSGRLALIGLDGATFRVLDPLSKAGVIPSLDGLRARGAEAVLRSTIPSYTPPAWISIATGVNPGRHGIFGFLATTPQEEPKIAHSGLIGATTLWRHLSDVGVGVGVFNVPMSYPPVPVNGFMVSGGLAAGWSDPDLPNFASDPEIGRLVSRVAGGRYPLDVVVSYENDWNSVAAIDRISSAQTVRRKALAACLERVDPQVVFAVFEGPDRLQHLQYQYFVECSDWYARPESSQFRDRAFAYFAELDRAVADLVDWAGPTGHVVVVSDHGAGPWEKTVNVNLLLEEWGYLRLPAVSRITRLGPVAGAGQRALRRLLPRSLLLKAKARVGRGIVWEETRAFASHVAEQGIHVNARGRLPRGILEVPETERVAGELTERLMAMHDPHDGAPMTDQVVARADVIRGPHEERAPDLFPLFRDQRYEISDTVAARSPVTDHRDRPWGYHHLDGVFVAAGPGVRQGRLEPPLGVTDVLPTALHLAGLPIPGGLDGEVARRVLGDEAISRPVTVSGGESPDGQSWADAYPFSREEEEAIEESLRGLGYLE